MTRRWLLVLIPWALLCCNTQERNTAFCCLTAADCASFGITGETLLCSDGLQCIQNTCVVQSCESSGCTADTPVCDTATDQCTRCTDSAQCSAFDGADVCDGNSGACVSCVTSADCDPATPVCGAAQTCSKCSRDNECASHACADDGTCVAEANVVYIAPNGFDTGMCTRDQPCAHLGYAAGRTGIGRDHIVAANGNYSYPALATISAPSQIPVWIHGHGSVHTGGDEDGFLTAVGPVTMRDVEIVNTVAGALNARSVFTLERAAIRAAHGINSQGRATIRDVRINVSGTGIGISSGSALIERVSIVNGKVGIYGDNESSIIATNVFISAILGLGIDLRAAKGTFEFVTITNTTGEVSGATAVHCSREDTLFRSSILWNPASAKPVLEGPCTVLDSLVGPTPFPGGVNADPQFVEEGKLSANSPARDLVTTGPAMDLEGDPRPQGAGFDAGADEYRP